MPEWMQQAIGPSGALVILIYVGRAGFKFFTEMIKEQDKKYDRQAERLDELLESTVRHITEQTAVLRGLKERVEQCPGAPATGRVAAIKNFRGG